MNKNPNSKWERTKRFFISRYSKIDYPGAEPRFCVRAFGFDLGVFILCPFLLFALTQFVFGSSSTKPRRKTEVIHRDTLRAEQRKSQIIDFSGSKPATSKTGTRSFGFKRKSPGSLVRLRLMNVIETYSTAPVHAQVIDRGLGNALIGGILIGDATPDPNFDRIQMAFRYVRDPQREGVAAPINARALSLDGTLGLEAGKREGFTARSVYRSAQRVTPAGGGGLDLKELIIRALSAGMVQEFGDTARVESNRAHVLSLDPEQEFFAELTDFFPGGNK
jgi:hypothetical protein